MRCVTIHYRIGVNMRGPPWRWRRRRGGPGRPPKPRVIGVQPRAVMFIPLDEFRTPIEAEPIHLTPDEVEALRLVYLEKMDQESAAKRMGLSRGSLWRCLESARRKVTQAIVEGRPILLVA